MERPLTAVPWPTVVVVVLLVSLAGCAGFVPGFENDEADRERYTVEDDLDPSEENDTETQPDYLVPGLTTDGVENRTLLLDQHFTLLEQEGENGTYTMETWYNETVNGTLQKATLRRDIVQHPDRWYRSQTVLSDGNTTTETTERWVEEGHMLTRSDEANEPVTYGVRDMRPQPEHPPELTGQLAELLETVRAGQDNVTVEERVRNDTTLYIVTRTVESHSRATEESHTIHIREDGFITDYSVTSVFEEESGKTTIYETDRTFRVTPNETLERPDWYEQAREAMIDNETANESR